MKFELSEPLKSKWRKAYIRTSSIDGRTRVDLYNTEQDRTTISYAKYLMIVYLGREMMDDEEVDHINGDKSDDRTENLQVLTKTEHKIKTAKGIIGRKYCKFRCPNCRVEFVRPYNSVYTSSRESQKLCFCSRSCACKFYRHVKWDWDDELLDLISREQLIEIFRIKKADRLILGYREQT